MLEREDRRVSGTYLHTSSLLPFTHTAERQKTVDVGKGTHRVWSRFLRSVGKVICLVVRIVASLNLYWTSVWSEHSDLHSSRLSIVRCQDKVSWLIEWEWTPETRSVNPGSPLGGRRWSSGLSRRKLGGRILREVSHNRQFVDSRICHLLGGQKLWDLKVFVSYVHCLCRIC